MKKAKDPQPVVVNNHYPTFDQLLGPVLGRPAAQPTDSFIPTTHTIGPPLSIPEFCTTFNLSDSICRVLVDNEFASASALKFVDREILVQMGMKAGAIAELRRAIEEWMVPL